jgi:biopolymer transport protein ExbD
MAKKVNVDLNMNPFIGLFALLVVNLLLTAVWNHVNALSTNTENSTASSSAQEPDKKHVTLSVTILAKSIEMAENSKGTNVAHQGTAIDVPGFVSALTKWRAKYPERKDVVLNTENGVSYEMLITVFDTLVGEGWHDVGVNTQ